MPFLDSCLYLANFPLPCGIPQEAFVSWSPHSTLFESLPPVPLAPGLLPPLELETPGTPSTLTPLSGLAQNRCPVNEYRVSKWSGIPLPNQYQRLQVIINKTDESCSPYSWDRNVAGCLEAVGITPLEVIFLGMVWSSPPWADTCLLFLPGGRLAGL